MSWVSKTALSISAVSLITLILARIFLHGWIVYLWWPLGFFIAGLLVSLVLDFKSYWSILSMRTAKNGMNLGLSVCIMLVILSSISYLTSLWDKTADLTEEKLYSLSPQTTQLLDSMTETPIHIMVFYKGKEASELKRNLKDQFKIFTQYTKRFKLEFVDAYKKNKLAHIYLEPLADKDSQDIFIFLNYADKKIRVKIPVTEETIVSAMIKASRRAAQNVYFTTGHRERSFFSSTAEGIDNFRKALEESSFNVVEWNFIEEKAPLPDTAQALLIIGPSQPFFEQEIKWIEEYIDKKGKVFIALDPGKNHNLAPFIQKKLGVQFKNNFVGSMSVRAILKNETSVMGVRYNPDSPVTRSFGQGVFRGSNISFFDEVSEVSPSGSAVSSWEILDLVYSDPSSYVMESITSKPSRENLKSRVVGVSVDEFPRLKDQQSKNNNDEKTSSEKKRREGFAAVIFGDSDFLANKTFDKGVHRDLALNVVSYLTDQGDLVSIRPKKPKGTKVVLTSSARYMFLIFAVFLPLVFSVLAGVVWFSRKKA